MAFRSIKSHPCRKWRLHHQWLHGRKQTAASLATLNTTGSSLKQLRWSLVMPDQSRIVQKRALEKERNFGPSSSPQHAIKNAPTSLLSILSLPCHLVLYLIPFFPLWMRQLYSDFLANALFFSYVAKSFVFELLALERAAVGELVHEAEEKIVHGAKEIASHVPDLIHPSHSDESRASGRGKEWFLSNESFPQATPEERKRFLKARDGDVRAATDMLKKYLEWRKPFDSMDEPKLQRKRTASTEEDSDWTRACQMAALSCSLSSLSTTPPCILFILNKNKTQQDALRTIDGNRVIQHLPARIDLTVASAEVYATALALYIDRCVPRDSMEKICVVIDTRPGKGWANIPAPRLVPFIKHAARLLNDLHPERLARCILFPVPSVAKFLWNTIKGFLDPDTAEKICILSGSAWVKSPVPADMSQYLRPDTMEWMESKRLSTFEEGSTKQKLQQKLSMGMG